MQKVYFEYECSTFAREALILIVIPESRSDIWNQTSLLFNGFEKKYWIPAFAGMTKNEVNLIFPSAH